MPQSSAGAYPQTAKQQYCDNRNSQAQRRKRHTKWRKSFSFIRRTTILKWRWHRIGKKNGVENIPLFSNALVFRRSVVARPPHRPYWKYGQAYIYDLSFNEKYQYSSIGTHIRKRGEGRQNLINVDSRKYFNKKSYQDKLLCGKSTRAPRTHEKQV